MALALNDAASSVADLDAYVASVLKELPSEAPELKLPDLAEWRIAGKAVGAMLKPLYEVTTGTGTLGESSLLRISTAMQAWKGPGRVDGLTVQHLRDYRKAQPLGPKLPGSKHKYGPPRWRHARWRCLSSRPGARS
jgi:hypothetical protein